MRTTELEENNANDDEIKRMRREPKTCTRKKNKKTKTNKQTSKQTNKQKTLIDRCACSDVFVIIKFIYEKKKKKQEQDT